MPKFRGILGDTFFCVEAETEDIALEKIKRLHLAEIMKDAASYNFVAWEDSTIADEDLQAYAL